MASHWLDRLGSVIPRRFSRHFVLLSLRESPLSGKEIIEKATIQSSGIWKPSPGLIYPMLGRLLDGGLIEEMDDRSEERRVGKECRFWCCRCIEKKKKK